MEVQCHFFQIPSELRIRIYELILGFSQPIKLRQTVAGSENTTLLRVNKRMYNEALPVLFDINTVAVTRNDFCKKTDVSLKCPVPSQHVRHLLMTSFGESIACSFLLDRCNVCGVPARGVFDALRAMPQLKSVTVDYRTHIANFRLFKEALACSSRVSHCDSTLKLDCIAVGIYRLRGEAFDNISFTFQNIPLARVWSSLSTVSDRFASESEEEETLARLRKLDADVPDKVQLGSITPTKTLISSDARSVAPSAVLRSKIRPACQYSHRVAEAWVDGDSLSLSTEGTRTAKTNDLTEAVQAFLACQTAPQCRLLLKALKDQETF